MRQFLLPAGFRYSRNRSDDAPPCTELELSGKEYHYITRVLRMRTGNTFPGIDREGNQFELTIKKITPHGLVLKIKETSSELPGVGENEDTQFYLFQALLKGKKMDTVIRQATETGVQHIIPLMTEHTVMRLESTEKERKKLERWNSIIREGMQQCGSSVHPRLYSPLDLRQMGGFWPEEAANSLVRLFFHQNPLANGSLHGYLSNWPHHVALVIGPEGGFSEDETLHLQNSGFLPVHLRTNILRAETAAIYALGAVQSILQEKEKWEISLHGQTETDTAE